MQFAMMIVTVDEKSGQMQLGEKDKVWAQMLPEMNADEIIKGAWRLADQITKDLGAELPKILLPGDVPLK